MVHDEHLPGCLWRDEAMDYVQNQAG
jgi:hypothetical protein